jgi:hypothetical protein
VITPANPSDVLRRRARAGTVVADLARHRCRDFELTETLCSHGTTFVVHCDRCGMRLFIAIDPERERCEHATALIDAGATR